MNIIYKAKPIIYEGIQFRSKLEARWYIFMKKLGWNIIYEPEIEGLNGWIPDYLIIGKQHKILVDVKPIDKAEEWETGYYDNEKKKYIVTKKHKDYDKIMNSGIKKLHDYELLILGTNLQLDENESMGIFYIRPDESDIKHCKKTKDDLYEDGNCIFSCVGD